MRLGLWQYRVFFSARPLLRFEGFLLKSLTKEKLKLTKLKHFLKISKTTMIYNETTNSRKKSMKKLAEGVVKGY